MANRFAPESKTKPQARQSQDLEDRRSGVYDNVTPKPASPTGPIEPHAGPA
jgi:hypothetical protein